MKASEFIKTMREMIMDRGYNTGEVDIIDVWRPENSQSVIRVDLKAQKLDDDFSIYIEE